MFVYLLLLFLGFAVHGKVNQVQKRIIKQYHIRPTPRYALLAYLFLVLSIYCLYLFQTVCRFSVVFCKKECQTCFFILVLSVKHRFSFCSSLSVCPISTMLPGQKGIKDRSSQKKKRVSTCGKTSSFHKKCLILALPLYFC